MVSKRLQLIFSTEDMKRLTIKESEMQMVIVADVHGMKCSQARRFINNIINIVRMDFQLIVIHGYNHGTAIKDMLTNDFVNPHIQDKHLDTYNQGMTHMLLA